jgi:phosphoenolpyruvate carboxykinase (GTP)
MTTMADVETVLDEAGLTNPRVREYVQYWADLTRTARVEVVGAADDARLIQESLDACEILPAGERRYSRSYHKDTARSEEQTIVATSNPADKGVYNNWSPASKMRSMLEERMRGPRRAGRCTWCRI